MELKIHRCIKRPGVIDRAKTYCVVYNEKGLYILCLGNAAQTPPRAANFVANAIADKAVGYIENSYEKKIRETETRILTEGLDVVSKEKKSWHLNTQQVEEFNARSMADGTIKIKIKGPQVNLTLWADGGYITIAQSIQEALGKR